MWLLVGSPRPLIGNVLKVLPSSMGTMIVVPIKPMEAVAAVIVVLVVGIVSTTVHLPIEEQ